MKKILIVTLVLMTLSFVLFAVKAEKPAMDRPGMDKPCLDCDQPGMMMGKGDGMGMGMGMHKNMMDDLNLTKEQKKKLDTLKDENVKFMNLKKAELENLHIDKQNAMQTEQYDKAKLLNKNITDLQLVIQNAMVDHHSAMMKELTPEQKAKWMEKMPMGMKHGQGMGMGKGPCMNNKKGPCMGNCK